MGTYHLSMLIYSTKITYFIGLSYTEEALGRIEPCLYYILHMEIENEMNNNNNNNSNNNNNNNNNIITIIIIIYEYKSRMEK